MEALMIAIVTLHFLAAALAPWLVRKMERSTFLLLALVPLGSFVWLLGPAQAAFDEVRVMTDQQAITAWVARVCAGASVTAGGRAPAAPAA